MLENSVNTVYEKESNGGSKCTKIINVLNFSKINQFRDLKKEQIYGF